MTTLVVMTLGVVGMAGSGAATGASEWEGRKQAASGLSCESAAVATPPIDFDFVADTESVEELGGSAAGAEGAVLSEERSATEGAALVEESGASGRRRFC